MGINGSHFCTDAVELGPRLSLPFHRLRQLYSTGSIINLKPGCRTDKSLSGLHFAASISLLMVQS